MLDVSGIYNKRFDLFHLKQVVNGLPIRARALHGNMGNAMGLDPVDEGKQVFSHRGEGLDLFVIRGDDAGYDVLFMNIETADMRIDRKSTRLNSSHVKSSYA